VPIRALLLCGGRSTRFGADKLLAGDPPLAARAARRLIEGSGHALAVMPLGKPALRRVLEAAGCEILETDRTTRGMGASLAAGVEATAGSAGWIVALGDMPSVAVETIRDVRRALEEGALLAAPFDANGRRGHPVGFSSELRAQLLALDGDVGARAVIEANQSGLKRIVTDDDGIFVDVDTPGDLGPALRRGD
jgi:molybdenum cofactor cytidylyltransferase